MNLFKVVLAPFIFTIRRARFVVMKGLPPLCGIQASTVPSATPVRPETGLA
jgi:hypothetical protein